VYVGWLSQAIVSPLAVAACGDEAGAAKIREVPRDFWLISSQNLNARTDTQLIVAQQMNETQARVVSQCFEDQFQVHCRKLRSSRRTSSFKPELDLLH
jgi:hypothetical protein